MDYTQRLQVLKYLQRGKTITSFQAFDEFGITRLSAIIFDLRKAGHNVQDSWVETVNRYGTLVRCKNYYIPKGV